MERKTIRSLKWRDEFLLNKQIPNHLQLLYFNSFCLSLRFRTPDLYSVNNAAAKYDLK